VPAAIITGTMARPSSPSVRLTALPAATITNTPKTMKKTPMSSASSLKIGKEMTLASEGGRLDTIANTASAAMPISKLRRARLEKPLWLCFVTLRKSS